MSGKEHMAYTSPTYTHTMGYYSAMRVKENITCDKIVGPWGHYAK